jgi:hypothetical protein
MIENAERRSMVLTSQLLCLQPPNIIPVLNTSIFSLTHQMQWVLILHFEATSSTRPNLHFAPIIAGSTLG